MVKCIFKQIFCGFLAFSIAMSPITVYASDSKTQGKAAEIQTEDQTSDHLRNISIQKENSVVTKTAITIADIVISNIPNQIFTGKAITPVPVVSIENKTLVNNIDYTLSYMNNLQPGKATITVTGIGNYAGSKTVDFYIMPAAPSRFKVRKTTESSVKLTWNKVNNATGYIIYRYNQKSKSYRVMKIISNKNITAFTHKKAASYTSYRYKIASYIEISNHKYIGTQSRSINGKTKLGRVNFRSAIGTNTTAKLHWDKEKSARGYMVYMSTSKNKGYHKIATVKAGTTRHTIENLNSGSTYYFKIRAYVKANKSKRYGAYSKVKKVNTRTDIRLEGIENQVFNHICTAKTNQYKKSKNQVMTNAHYLALEELCESYSGNQISDNSLLKKAKSQKYKKYKGNKKVSLKSSNAMKLEFTGVHMDQMIAEVQGRIKGKRDYVFVRVYYNAKVNTTTVYVVNGAIK
ncbi:fibronectin type III domain-containing protein [Anaerosacchariphilus polymeriproducens]|uniref:fibronectin type III domain-containing protein n=1 Tax=Anaerosacchariphilus polymeriproducens TaxID=1812858 RepID=UPI00139030E7|nr:fibronectin type III domain-containing protein [Anaerosacchariphilus polymeriproducens]